jgi:hypothetical protein
MIRFDVDGMAGVGFKFLLAGAHPLAEISHKRLAGPSSFRAKVGDLDKQWGLTA